MYQSFDDPSSAINHSSDYADNQDLLRRSLQLESKGKAYQDIRHCTQCTQLSPGQISRYMFTPSKPYNLRSSWADLILLSCRCGRVQVRKTLALNRRKFTLSSEIYQVTGPVERFAGQIASHGYVVGTRPCLSARSITYIESTLL